MTGRISFMGQ
jgi:hypothetical protein